MLVFARGLRVPDHRRAAGVWLAVEDLDEPLVQPRGAQIRGPRHVLPRQVEVDLVPDVRLRPAAIAPPIDQLAGLMGVSEVDRAAQCAPAVEQVNAEVCVQLSEIVQ